MFYTHISDQYAPFHIKVISATDRDATHVLDELLYHESDLQIQEHYTDTSGYTEHLFAICHLLGFRFAPRMRDLADKRLYTFESQMTNPVLAPLLGSKINVQLLEKSWNDICTIGKFDSHWYGDGFSDIKKVSVLSPTEQLSNSFTRVRAD